MQTHFDSCKLYLDIIRKTLKTYNLRLEKRPEDEELTNDKDLLEVMYSSMSLLQVIFLPFHGFLHAVVGRELMHWLNENYVAPTGEDGMGLLELEEPWLHPPFWNFVKT